MKKALSIIASCFLLIFCFTFVSCGTSALQGTYKLFQVVTVKNGDTTVQEATDYKVGGDTDLVFKFEKSGKGKITATKTQEGGERVTTTEFTWKLDGSNLSLKYVGEDATEEESDLTAYFYDGMLVYTLSQDSEETVMLIFKKQTFKISSLFAKRDKGDNKVVTTVAEDTTTSTVA